LKNGGLNPISPYPLFDKRGKIYFFILNPLPLLRDISLKEGRLDFLTQNPPALRAPSLENGGLIYKY